MSDNTSQLTSLCIPEHLHRWPRKREYNLFTRYRDFLGNICFMFSFTLYVYNLFKKTWLQSWSFYNWY